MTRLMMTLAAGLVAMLVAAPVAAQSNLTKPKVIIEYKGPQVLDACDPGMPSTHSAVNVEAHGGFFEPGSSYAGHVQARVSFSPSDVLEIAYPDFPNSWSDIPSNGQLKLTIEKGDNIVRFRQKGSSYAPMPTSERRVVRVNLLTSCSDCRGAPGGTPVTSSLQVGLGSAVTEEPYNVDEGQSCRSPDHAGPTFSHYESSENLCRVRVRDGETYRWQVCNTHVATNYCYAVPDRISDPVCENGPARYSCEPPKTSAWQTRTSDTTYQVGTSRTIFNVQYNGYGCD